MNDNFTTSTSKNTTLKTHKSEPRLSCGFGKIKERAETLVVPVECDTSAALKQIDELVTKFKDLQKQIEEANKTLTSLSGPAADNFVNNYHDCTFIYGEHAAPISNYNCGDVNTSDTITHSVECDCDECDHDNYCGCDCNCD